MKLLYIAQYFNLPDESTGTRAYDLALSFVRKDVDVTVISSYVGENDAPLWTFIELNGIKIHRMNCPYSNTMSFMQRIHSFFRFMRGATKKAQTIDCDVVLATSTPLSVGFPALVMYRKKHIPYIFEVRDVWPGVPIAMGYFRNKLVQKILYGFEKRIYKKASAIVPLSTGMDENIKRRYPNDKSSIIPNISEINRFADTTKSVNIIVPKGKKVMLYAGTFGVVNGLGYVIELASCTLKYDPDLWYYLVGGGKEKDKIIKQAELMGVLNKNVFIFDSVKKSDLPYLYSIASVGSSFVIDIPALWDNSANKFFDTLAAHRPMIINHEGWQADTIRKYECGLVLLPKMNDEMVKDFVQYMNDDAILRKHGENAFALAKEQFSLEIAVEKYLGIFETVVNQQKK